MKKSIIMIALVAAFLFPQVVAADTITPVGSGGTYDGYGPYQTGDGGEFTVRPSNLSLLSGYTAYTMNQGGNLNTFQTFCLEGDEYLYGNTTHDAVLNDRVVGQSQGTGGDPLSVGSAFLYYQFATGALSGYNYTGARTTSAGLLQNALWWLEGEKSLTYDASNPFELLAVNTFGSAAGAMANNSSYATPYQVSVLNLYAEGHAGDPNYGRQDVLVVNPVPEPASFLLLSLGLGLIGVTGMRRKLKG